MATTRRDTLPVDPDGFRRAVERGLQPDASAAVLLLDIDRFMAVNEKGGREAGDEILRLAAATLKKWAGREKWALGRLGGDEFALFAGGLSLEQALLRAERLRTELNAAYAKAAPKGLKVTSSIGVAGAPRDAKTASDLMAKADLALYAAKEQGGDAVALAPGDEMVLKSSYYTASQLGRLRSLAERLKKKESVILREGLDDVLRKYDRV